MNRTTTDGRVNPARSCEQCDDAIRADEEAHHDDGELLCGPCRAERVASDHRGAIEEAEAEIAGLEVEVEELEETYLAELAELQRKIKTWRRRERDGRRRLRELGSIAAAVGESRAPGEAPAPIRGGAPFEPSAEDLADFAAWAAEVDARRDREERDAAMEPEVERPMWGYE